MKESINTSGRSDAHGINYKNLLDYIDNRIFEFKREKRRLVGTISNKRRIHPAIKQLNGRILELRSIKHKLIKKIIEKK